LDAADLFQLIPQLLLAQRSLSWAAHRSASSLPPVKPLEAYPTSGFWLAGSPVAIAESGSAVSGTTL
jgi:hypothetical protein